MGASRKIIDLRQLLAERFPETRPPAPSRFQTALPTLEATLEGGLPKSAITEITSPQLSGGSALLLAQLLHGAARARHRLALIDGRDSFDPQPLGNSSLRHLLWVRCQAAVTAVKAADLLLRDGNFPLILLDLVLNPAEELRKIPQTHWYRLQRLVESAPTAFLVLTRRSMISSAQCKLVLENSWRLSDLDGEEDHRSRLKFSRQRLQGGRLAATG